MQPRTPRATSDRGRYPEEAGHEESQREDTPSDDDGHESSTFAFLQSSEPINIVKPCTPANSVNGDEMNMLISESPGGPMDVDIVSFSHRSLSFVIETHSTPAFSQWLPPHWQMLLPRNGDTHRLLRRAPYDQINGNVRF
jgi:hypothetical protein